MGRIILFVLFLASNLIAHAQMSDFITVKKKNNRTVKTFMSGMPITLETLAGSGVDGWIQRIENDTVFVKVYQVQRFVTQFGTTAVDTFGSVTSGIPFKDIRRIYVDEKESFPYVKNGMIFMIGGLGYSLLNVINTTTKNESLDEPSNLRNLGIAMGVAAGGFVLNRIQHKKKKNGGNLKIAYVKMKHPA